ncbi:hypothetical protein MKW94_006076, partial [Papaver nudicaule]|nr:hypothetical protein [Papaver nudicaule]
KESRHGRRADKVKDEVRCMLVDQQKVSLISSSCYGLLKLVNIIQRLGIGYHFADEIKAALCNIKDENNYSWEKEDLFMQAVRFRLLRQHGFEVSQ